MLWKTKYNVLIIGCNGMLGKELYERLTLLSMSKLSNIGTVIGIDKDAYDMSKRHALGNYFMESIHFDYCINCAAYTDTNAAQNTKEGRELDYRLNALMPKYIAESCKFWKTKLIHISTDYVFSEKSDDAAYNSNNSPLLFKPDSEPFPCNIYGYDKLLGENGIKEMFGTDSKNYCILRVSWLYGKHNNKSFIHKFIRNLVKAVKSGKNEIEMTSNEYSIPTSCSYVIDSIIDVIEQKLYGIRHAVPKCNNCAKASPGVSRLEFAEKILQFLINGEYNTDKNYTDFSNVRLVGVRRDSYWPEYSVMKTTNQYAVSWDEDLTKFLTDNISKILQWCENE